MDEAQARLKIAGRNINNLGYADDTPLMAESEELKSLLMKAEEESEKVALKLNIQKTKIMASHHFMANRWENNGNSDRLYFLGAPKSLQMATVTNCSDFGAQENKVSHCFYFFPIYLPWSDGTGCHDLRFLNVEF